VNLDVQLVDLPEVSREGQMFVLTRIRLNLRGEVGDLDVWLVDPPGVPKEANFADTMFVLMRYALQMVEDNLERTTSLTTRTRRAVMGEWLTGLDGEEECVKNFDRPSVC
jgi:hypothetical protein